MKKIAFALVLFLAVAGTSRAADLPGVYTHVRTHMQARVIAIRIGQGNRFLVPKQGDHCLAAHLVVRNLGRRVDRGGTGAFEIVTPKGRTYWQSGSCPVRRPYLPVRPIAPHAQLAGWITIELPKTLHRASLAWTDGGRLSPPGVLTQLTL
jgi:hypothetical protein